MKKPGEDQRDGGRGEVVVVEVGLESLGGEKDEGVPDRKEGGWEKKMGWARLEGEESGWGEVGP